MSDGPSLRARAFVALQHLLPQLWLSGVVGRIARTRAGWIRKPLIRAFMRGYRPEMADALQPNPLAYESFNAFFTRALRPGARAPPGDTPPKRWQRTKREWASAEPTHSRRFLTA